jgi:hypothetical protein
MVLEGYYFNDWNLHQQSAAEKFSARDLADTFYRRCLDNYLLCAEHRARRLIC